MISSKKPVLEHMTMSDLETTVVKILSLPERPWLESDADSAESRSARAYNSALGTIKNLLRGAHDEPKANLGIATTDELLTEIRTRIEMDWYAGGGGLGYSTVKGRPTSTVTYIDVSSAFPDLPEDSADAAWGPDSPSN